MIEAQKSEIREQSKKPYTPPQLTVHGNVERITQGGGIGIKDGNGRKKNALSTV